MTTFLRRVLAISTVAVIGALHVPAMLGSVSLAFSGAADAATAPRIALSSTDVGGLALGMQGMMPGDSYSGAVEVRNDGGQELRYAITAVSAAGAVESGDLAGTLLVSVRTADVQSSAASAGEATDEDPCDEASGTELRAAATLDASGHLVGDSATGRDRGDRTLAAGAGETLCFTVHMPITAGNEQQRASTALSLGFSSEATANNP